MGENQHSHDGKSGGRNQEHLKKLWSIYNSKAQFSDSDLDMFLDNLKESAGTTEAYIESIREEFEKELKQANTVAEKVVSRLSQKHGQLDDRQILAKVKTYQEQYKLSNPMMSAIIRYVQDFRSADPSLSAKGFNFKPAKHNAIGNMLGNPRVRHNIGQTQIKSEDAPYLKEILKLHAQHQHLHAAIIDQTIRYKDCQFTLTSRRFKQDNNPADAVAPLFVALFGPKIRSLDWHFLLPSLSNIIKTRADGSQPSSLVESNLLWYISRDASTISCSGDKSPMHDCLKRVRIQIALWQAVLHLRNGIMFNPDNTQINVQLMSCNPNTYMAADMLINNDEHQMIERLFSAFAFKRIIMSTLPYVPQIPGQNNFHNPFYSAQIQNIATEAVSIFTLRLPNLPDELMDHVDKDEMEVISLKERLNHQDFFVDPTNQQVVPHNIRVVGAHGVFVVYINRHKSSFNIHSIHQMSTPFTFTQLPVIDQQNRIANIYPVDCPTSLSIGELSKSTFKLRSFVSISVPDDVTGEFANNKLLIAGSETYVIPDNSNDETNDMYYRYNPNLATKLSDADRDNNTGELMFNKAIVKGREDDIQINDMWKSNNDILQYTAKVLVYVDTNQEDLESKREFYRSPV